MRAMLERMFSQQEFEHASNRGSRPSWMFGSILTLEYLLPDGDGAVCEAESRELVRCHRRVYSYDEAVNLIDSWVNLPRPWRASDVEDHARGLGWVRMSPLAKQKHACARVAVGEGPHFPTWKNSRNNIPLIAITVHPPRSQEQNPRKDASLESAMRFLLYVFTQRYGDPEIERFWGGEYRDWPLADDLRLRLSFGLGMSTVWIYDPVLKEDVETFVTLPDNLPEDFGRSAEEQPPYRTFKRSDFSERWRRDREQQLEFRQNARSSLKVSVWSWLALLALIAYPIVLVIQLANKIWGD